jgi:hypothetical protein
MSENIEWHNERRKVSSLNDYSKNPRILTKKGMEDLEASIKSVGYIDPIAIDTDGTILGGHARKKTLKKLGFKEVDVRVPERKLTEQEQDETVIRLNRNEAGEFDFDILANQFDMPDLVRWGFDGEELGIVPAFGAVGEEEQAKLDESNKKVTCPKCDYEFTP